MKMLRPLLLALCCAGLAFPALASSPDEILSRPTVTIVSGKAPAAAKKVKQPVKAHPAAAKTPVTAQHAKNAQPYTLRIGIREGRGSVAASSPQGLGVYRGNLLWKKAAANVPVKISLSGTNLAVNGAISKEPLRLQSLAKGGSVKITDGYTYRGVLEVMKTPGRWGLTVVNVVPLESYLYGVVGKEMSPSWSSEALKAQAVAARTYAVAHKGYYQKRGFDMTDDTNSQVYAGKNGESPSVIQAVNATRGEILTYNGQPIEALFCSTAGGWTENSENVWGTRIPYLRAVPDFSDTMPGYRWSVTTTPEQMAAKLNAAGKGVGTIKSLTLSPLQKRPMTAADRGVSGRVQTLTVQGTRGKVDVKGAAFQAIFGLKSTLFDFANPKTALPDPDSGKAARKTVFPVKKGQAITIYGFGWGHGLGMSQYGAYQMARQHASEKDFYRTILTHYYTGTKIEKLY